MAEAKIAVLQSALFEQIERLGHPDLDGDALDREVTRTKALTALAGQAIAAGRLQLDAMEAATRNQWDKKRLPLAIGNGTRAER